MENHRGPVVDMFSKGSHLDQFGHQSNCRARSDGFLGACATSNPKTTHLRFQGPLDSLMAKNAFDSCLTQPTHNSEWLHMYLDR